MDIKDAIRIFEDISELELYKTEWDKVEEALKKILIKTEEENRNAWDEGYTEGFKVSRNEF